MKIPSPPQFSLALTRIKVERIKAGMSSARLAEFIEVTQPTVCGYENRKHGVSLNKQRRLSALFNLSVEELFDTTGKAKLV
ncbi:MAG: helix-turn-helix transcriptional regulator [Candidatus Riesia sp.]|nr:helix-turn-helix transcriptional regulator [Candidatus Riesia sp.]